MQSVHKKRSIPLGISSVNVTKSAVSAVGKFCLVFIEERNHVCFVVFRFSFFL